MAQHSFKVFLYFRFIALYIPTNSPLYSDPASVRRVAKNKLRCALQRETSVLFFCAVCPKDSRFLVIVECTTPGRFQRRKAFWQNEGFFFHHYVKHSGHFHAKPNSEFGVDISGNVEFLSRPAKRLTLNFSPRSYKYQSFYMSRVDRKLPLIGEINIYESRDGRGEEALTKLPVDLPEPSQCVLS